MLIMLKTGHIYIFLKVNGETVFPRSNMTKEMLPCIIYNRRYSYFIPFVHVNTSAQSPRLPCPNLYVERDGQRTAILMCP